MKLLFLTCLIWNTTWNLKIYLVKFEFMPKTEINLSLIHSDDNTISYCSFINKMVFQKRGVVLNK